MLCVGDTVWTALVSTLPLSSSQYSLQSPPDYGVVLAQGRTRTLNEQSKVTASPAEQTEEVPFTEWIINCGTPSHRTLGAKGYMVLDMGIGSDWSSSIWKNADGVAHRIHTNIRKLRWGPCYSQTDCGALIFSQLNLTSSLTAKAAEAQFNPKYNIYANFPTISFLWHQLIGHEYHKGYVS